MPKSPLRIMVRPQNNSPRPLNMGGANPLGNTIAVNQHYLTLNGRPWVPVMGEFHFSRYPMESWEEELLKMKAGGISVVATYLFWIHHEEVEGQYNWSGACDIRRFVLLCKLHDLLVYPRIGPWAHGECRNGGFPDWLLQRCGSEVRQDSPVYLAHVLRYFKEIGRRLNRLLWKDGGPVIGIQLENELTNNPQHIQTLKGLAREAGFDVPLYTMTGWGPAEVPDGEVIPVFGGYPDAFWDRQVEGWSRSSIRHYFYSSLRDDNTIGADLRPRAEIGDLSYLSEYPFGTCETGGGMQVSYHRRPRISADDIAALAMVKVGNGSNLQGYYMYHGGANPLGQHSTLQESQASGYPNDLPVINYDFQAPIGQYGQVRESYHALRPLHLFLHDFGDRLAPLSPHLPASMPASVDDRKTLRWCIRSDGSQGFLFINNHQRIESLPDQLGIRFSVTLDGEKITLPSHPVDIPSGLYTFWPLNFNLNGALLKYATAQPICQLSLEDGPCYVFASASGIASEFVFDEQSVIKIDAPSGQQERKNKLMSLTGLIPGPDCLIRLTCANGTSVSILLLDHILARQLYKLNVWGRERLFLCGESLYVDGSTLHVQSTDPEMVFSVYPAPRSVEGARGHGLTANCYGIFTRYRIPTPAVQIHIEVHHTQAGGPCQTVRIGPAGVAQPPEDAAFAAADILQVKFPLGGLDDVHEALLITDYVGDCARAYMGENLIDDHFYYGSSWEVGLGRFKPEILQKGLSLHFIPLLPDAPIYFPPESLPEFGNVDDYLHVKSVTIKPVYDTTISASKQ